LNVLAETSNVSIASRFDCGNFIGSWRVHLGTLRVPFHLPCSRQGLNFEADHVAFCGIPITQQE
jgi:hypothetical protein